MQFKKKYFIGISLGIIVLVTDIVFYYGTRYFAPGIVIAVSISWAQFWLDFFLEDKRQRQLETRFLDFVRNLAGAIKSGMPVSRAIIHTSKIGYGPLTKHINKLAHQVEWSIPVHRALILFSNSTKNDIIKRSVSTVIEAEKSGGNMEDVLESITTSLVEIKKIKEARRSSVHSQVVQSYVIFLVFLGVMVVIKKLLLPYLVGTNQGGLFGMNYGQGSAASSINLEAKINFSSIGMFIYSFEQWLTSLNGIFLMLSLIQGLFAGIIIGKLSEGYLIAGLKHSLILMTLAFLVTMVFS